MPLFPGRAGNPGPPREGINGRSHCRLMARRPHGVQRPVPLPSPSVLPRVRCIRRRVPRLGSDGGWQSKVANLPCAPPLPQEGPGSSGAPRALGRNTQIASLRGRMSPSIFK
jgi:hypothetical protein